MKTKQLKLEGKHGVFWRVRMRKANSGEKNGMYGIPSPMKGKYQTEEAKQLISKGNLGKPKTEEHKQHIREARLGTHPTEEAKQNMSKATSGEKNPMFGRTGEKCPMYGKTGEDAPMYGVHRYGELAPNWQDGISFEPYCIKFDDDLKERVRNFFNRICFICGMSEAENGQKLSVHHVNYNKMVCCNDVKPLFVPLCMSCHSKTQKDRKYWEEFFTISLNYLTNGQCFSPKKENGELIHD